jgi:hypothetical protein
LASFASFAVLGGSIGGAVWDPANRPVVPQTLAALNPSPGRPAATVARLAPGTYGYVVVAWPEAADTLTVTATGVTAARAAEAVGVGTREHGAVTPSGARWVVERACQPNGACEGDGHVYVSVANGRRTALAVTISAAG